MVNSWEPLEMTPKTFLELETFQQAFLEVSSMFFGCFIFSKHLPLEKVDVKVFLDTFTHHAHLIWSIWP